MSEAIRIETPLTQDKVKGLKAGDNVLISGVIYTGRDAAHKRMIEALEQGGDLPFLMKDQVIYFVGPTPAKEGQVIGSAGPTTSGRMDAYSPKLIERG
ncbi:MAG TPA: fumarate hydratase C-terminal domain-containing protein, partial [Desulfosporosinus sp.]